MAKDKLAYYTQKIDGKPPELEYEYRAGHAKALDEFWKNAPAGRYTVELKRIPKEKTHQQVKTIFGLLIERIIIESNDKGIDTSAFLKMIITEDVPNGVPLTKDFLYQLFLLVCPVYDENGQRLTLSKFSTEQANGFFDRCVDLMCSHDIYIPPPNPNWRKEKETAK